ncbi:MAG TPA: sigma-70 family RNA polymerase sigma factor [Planctomycetota bacterium]|nr:sigma-70 family RNA polymerase sigma factor [Planctomycetota bacterium]HRR82335.1 sigma-70 family RNA polymerase sigma factor [Planctomycetota bacterium]
MPDVELADEVLVAQAQRGDRAAFGLLVERHQNALFNGLCRMVNQREDAEDLAQEAFVKAFRGLGSFEGRSSFYTWLYSIAYHLVISHRRKFGSARHLSPMSLQHGADEDGGGLQVQDDADPPEARAEQHETRQRIERAIAGLEDDYRAVIVMRDIDGLDYQAIAEAIGCPQGTVKSRLHRARLALREQLKDLAT